MSGKAPAIVTQRSGAGVAIGVAHLSYVPLPAQQVLYLHQDHLGSTTALTNELGNVVERMAYDAWGGAG
jgi:uncharacterized protein RhaS with RHS repeats